MFIIILNIYKTTGPALIKGSLHISISRNLLMMELKAASVVDVYKRKNARQACACDNIRTLVIF